MFQCDKIMDQLLTVREEAGESKALLKHMDATPLDEIDRFLATGGYDVLFWEWPGAHALDRIVRGTQALTDALVEEVRRREAGVTVQVPPPVDDLVAFTRAKVEPMVRGLFSRKESEPVLALLEKSLVFVMPEHVEPQIRRTGLDTGWQIANMYLDSIGAERLDPNSERVVGFSEETTCYVSMEYFSDKHPFADYVIHEAAHVFHNCKRRTAGLPETRRRQWLLPIDFSKRETFAYACEAYSRILERAKRRKDRQALLDEAKGHPHPPVAKVDTNEYFEILAEALDRRNGWKAILERCS